MSEQIKKLLESGLSLRKTAKQLGINFSVCRSIAIKNKLYEPKSTKIVSGKTTCIQCNNFLPISKFPNAIISDYRCSNCLNYNNHYYQLKKFNCTPDLYNDLLLKQENSCAICKKKYGHKTSKNKTAKLAVDHDHKTGEIRGLLCNACNRGLGFIGEENLEKALEYIKKTHH